MANEITWMNRTATRRMPAMLAAGAVLSDAITISGTNQYVDVDGEPYAAPANFIDGPMIRVSLDEDAYIAVSPATSGGTAVSAATANAGIPVKAGQVEYFEIQPGWFVAICNAKA